MMSIFAVLALGWYKYGPDAEVPSALDESAWHQTVPEALVAGVVESPPAQTAPVTVQARVQPTLPKTQTVARASVGATNPGDGDGNPGPNGEGPPSPPGLPKETPPPPTAWLDYFWYIKWAFALVALWRLWSVCAPVVRFAYRNWTGIMATAGVLYAAKNVPVGPNPPQKPNPPTATPAGDKAKVEAHVTPIPRETHESAMRKLKEAYRNSTGITATAGVLYAAKNVPVGPNPPQKPNPPTATPAGDKAKVEAHVTPIPRETHESAMRKLNEACLMLDESGY